MFVRMIGGVEKNSNFLPNLLSPPATTSPSLHDQKLCNAVIPVKPFYFALCSANYKTKRQNHPTLNVFLFCRGLNKYKR